MDKLKELFETDTFKGDTDAVNAALNGTVEIRLTADDAKKQDEIDDIKAGIGTQKVAVLVDLTVDMFITPNGQDTIKKNLPKVEELLTVAIPLDSAVQNKANYHVYRHHDGSVEELKRAGSAPMEGSFNVAGNYIYIYSQKFSTYAITYETGGGETGGEENGGGSGGQNGGGTSSYKYYTITVKAGEGGSFVPNRSTVSVREGDSAGFDIHPDAGYRITDVTVDGNSIGAAASYLFRNVRENHTINATFEKLPVMEQLPQQQEEEKPVLRETEPTQEEEHRKTEKSLENDQSNSEEALDNIKKDAIHDLEQKRDEAIKSLPDSFTKEQRQAAIDEINRIYDEAVAAIENAKTAEEVSEFYNKAIREFAEIVKNAGGEMESMVPTGDAKPFIMLSAILALAAVFGAVLAWRRRKEEEDDEYSEEEEEKGSSRQKPMIAALAAVLAVIIFLLTTGWQGIALVNWWTIAVAIPTAGSLWLGMRSDKKEEQ